MSADHLDEKPGVAEKKRVGIWPILVFALVSTWFIARPGPSATPVYCDRDKPANEVDVVMLSAEWCTYCRRARRFFVDQSINYCEHDIETSETGRRLYEQSEVKVIPIIRIRDELLVGYSKPEIKHALMSNDLYPLEEL